MAVVTFDPNAWKQMFPEFTSVPGNTAQGYFNRATLLCRNDGGGPIQDPFVLQTLLFLLTAHIAKLYFIPATGTPAPPNTPVGQIDRASEGSVSVGYQNAYAPGTAQWYQQSKYGAEYWADTSIFRRFHYIAGPGFNVGFGFYSDGWDQGWQYPGNWN